MCVFQANALYYYGLWVPHKADRWCGVWYIFDLQVSQAVHMWGDTGPQMLGIGQSACVGHRGT